MAIHNFDTEVAATVGVNAAVIYQNIRFWVEKNKANDRHYYDDEYWSYNSVAAFALLFPYLSPSQIKLAINKLKDNDYIGISNHSKTKFDKVNWYCDLKALDWSETANRGDRNSQTITDSKPDDLKYIKKIKLPMDWVPSTEDEMFAQKKNWGLDHTVEQGYKFRDYHTSRGTLMADWSAAWRTWVRNDFDNKNKPAPKPIDMIAHIANAR